MSYSEFYFDLNNISGRIIRLLRISRISYEATPKSFSANLHSHDFTELLFVCDGKGKLYLDGAFHDIESGHLILIAPNQEHYEVALTNQNIQIHSIAFNGVGDYPILQNIIHFADKDYDYISSTISQLFSEYKELSAHNYLYCQNLFENLIIYLLRQKGDTITTRNELSDEQIFFTVRQICEYIDNNFNTVLSTDKLARSAALSTGHFIRLFRELTGSPPHQYIMQKRLEAAVHSLLYTDKPINVICYEIGFSDINNFIRKFKKSIGQTPHEYRLMQRPLNKKGLNM